MKLGQAGRLWAPALCAVLSPVRGAASCAAVKTGAAAAAAVQAARGGRAAGSAVGWGCAGSSSSSAGQQVREHVGHHAQLRVLAAPVRSNHGMHPAAATAALAPAVASVPSNVAATSAASGDATRTRRAACCTAPASSSAPQHGSSAMLPSARKAVSAWQLLGSDRRCIHTGTPPAAKIAWRALGTLARLVRITAALPAWTTMDDAPRADEAGRQLAANACLCMNVKDRPACLSCRKCSVPVT